MLFSIIFLSLILGVSRRLRAESTSPTHSSSVSIILDFDHVHPTPACVYRLPNIFDVSDCSHNRGVESLSTASAMTETSHSCPIIWIYYQIVPQDSRVSDLGFLSREVFTAHHDDKNHKITNISKVNDVSSELGTRERD